MNRKRLLGAAALGLAALLSVPVPVGAVDRALHLDEAIRLALQNNERILSERAAHVGAEADLTSAKGAYDPLIEADALLEERTLGELMRVAQGVGGRARTDDQAGQLMLIVDISTTC